MSRETYDDRIIDYVLWIRSEFNLSDTIAKETILPQLVEIMETRKLKHDVTPSVKRAMTKTTDANTFENKDNKLPLSQNDKTARV